MWLIIVSFMCQSAISSPPKEKAKSPLVFEQAIEGEAQYLTLFKSMDDYFNQMSRFGLIDGEDRKTIDQLLSKYNIDITRPFSISTTSSGKVTFGKISLWATTENKVQLSNGRMISFTKNMSFTGVFSKTLQAILARENASIFNLFVMPATASEGNGFFPPTEASRAAVAAAVNAGAGFIFSSAETALAFSIKSYGLAGCDLAFPFAVMKYQLTSLIFNHNVSCSEDGSFRRYEYVPYDSLIKDEYKLLREGKDQAFQPKILAAQAAICPLFKHPENVTAADSNPRLKPEVPKEIVQAVFGSNDIKCTPERASNVANWITKELAKTKSSFETVVKQQQAHNSPTENVPGATK